MRTRTALLTTTSLFAIAAFAFAADLPTKIAPPPDYKSDMSQLAEAGTPGLPHRYLGHFVGDWDVAIEQRRPGSPAIELTATATFVWALDGRFLQEDLRAEIDGFSIEMLRFLGFDNFKNRYTLAWMGSTSTAITNATGYQSVDGNEITFFGTMDEPHLNLHDRSIKAVYRSTGKDTFVVELHDLHIPDPNSLVLSMEYTRRQ